MTRGDAAWIADPGREPGPATQGTLPTPRSPLSSILHSAAYQPLIGGLLAEKRRQVTARPGVPRGSARLRSATRLLLLLGEQGLQPVPGFDRALAHARGQGRL